MRCLSKTARHLFAASLVMAGCGLLVNCGTVSRYIGARTIPLPTRPEAGLVGARDGQLFLDGQRYRFVGLNVYSLASGPAGSGLYYCGRQHSDADVDAIMNETVAMGASVIRFSAYQSFTAGGADFSRIDFLVEQARRHGLKLIPVLENQWPDCTRGGYKYAGWYDAGYRRPYGGYRRSFTDHVRTIVGRYRDEPVILMWQVMNEAESRTRLWEEDSEALLSFAEDIGSLVKSIDDRHPLCLGTSGLRRPGSGGEDYRRLAGIGVYDVVEAHDYGAETVAWPEIIREARTTAGEAGKPFIIGEVGVRSPPRSRSERARLIRAKLEAAWAADVDGIMIWSYRAGDGTDRDFEADDPLVETIRDFTAGHH